MTTMNRQPSAIVRILRLVVLLVLAVLAINNPIASIFFGLVLVIVAITRRENRLLPLMLGILLAIWGTGTIILYSPGAATESHSSNVRIVPSR